MNKEEFLETLKMQLLSELSQEKAQAQVQYYAQYIEGKIREGSTEQQVIEQLGDPRLIAKTILSTPGREEEGNRTCYGENTRTQKDFSGYGERPTASGRKRVFAKLDLSTWYGKVLVILAAGLFLFVLFTILSVLIPVVVIACLIIFAAAQIRKRKK